jgi:hypothetical protein
MNDFTLLGLEKTTSLITNIQVTLMRIIRAVHSVLKPEVSRWQNWSIKKML